MRPYSARSKAIIAVFAVLLLIFPASGQQHTYTIDNVPNPQTADTRAFVSNPDGILSASTVSGINATLYDLRRTTSAEVAVVALGSIGNDTPEDFGVRLFEKWKIGQQGADNGLLILLVTDQRRIRFEVGYGLEGVMTDALSKRIQTQRMAPYFSNNDWDNGMMAGVQAVNEVLTDPDSEFATGNAYANTASNTGLIDFWIRTGLIMGAMFLIVFISVLAQRRKNKCPKCGAQMQVVNEATSRTSPSIRTISTTYRCPKCGYTVTRNRNEHIGSGGFFGGLGGGIGGGMMGGGGRSGGFGGGSFGGGRSGGGGATTKF